MGTVELLVELAIEEPSSAARQGTLEHEAQYEKGESEYNLGERMPKTI